MREPFLVTFGAFFVAGAVATLVWMRAFERRKYRMGWVESGDETSRKRRLFQFLLCVAAAADIFVAVIFGLGLQPGRGRTNELGLIFLLVSIVWFVFRRDIARYQYQIAMTMFGRPRPEPDEYQRQLRAAELIGIAFSGLLFSAGALLLALNGAFS
jgi:hypothetical protein